MARRMALRRRLWVTYHSRGRPGGSGRFATGEWLEWTDFGFGFSAAAGTGILLSRSGRSAGGPAIPSNTATSLPTPTDIQGVRRGTQTPRWAAKLASRHTRSGRGPWGTRKF